MNISNEQLIEQLTIALKECIEALECLAYQTEHNKTYYNSFEKNEDITEVVEDAFKLSRPLLKRIKGNKL